MAVLEEEAEVSVVAPTVEGAGEAVGVRVPGSGPHMSLSTYRMRVVACASEKAALNESVVLPGTMGPRPRQAPRWSFPEWLRTMDWPRARSSARRGS